MMTMTMEKARKPFAPLETLRLQTLASLKNRQNTLSALAAGKRKVTAISYNDSENIDPLLCLPSKKMRSASGSSFYAHQIPTKINYSALSPSAEQIAALPELVSKSAYPNQMKHVFSTRSQVPSLKRRVVPTSTTAPAGRSPTRKRVGILNRRITPVNFTRIDPPKHAATMGPGFNIDTALSGTIPSYAKRQASFQQAESATSSIWPDMRASWNFEIYEDTPEEFATNLMEHSTCILDISSDEDNSAKVKDDRGKENVPPIDDLPQLSSTTDISEGEETVAASMKHTTVLDGDLSRQQIFTDGTCEVDRAPLGELVPVELCERDTDHSSEATIPADLDNTENFKLDASITSKTIPGFFPEV